MKLQALDDGGESFDVTVLELPDPRCAVLFAVGAGGDPLRHLPLLQALRSQRCMVVAPHFERLVDPSPTEEELVLRARRLALALERLAPPELPVAGVGHSIGATMLLALAGGQAWLRAGHPLPLAHAPRLARLTLLAPATGYFRAPQALDAVRVPILAWAGDSDLVTPASQVRALKESMGELAPVEVRIAAGAGHFSFMNVLPPQVTDPLGNREAFLAELGRDVSRFVVG